MKPNKTISFGLENVEDIAQVIDLPYGDLFSVGVNRWNGNVFLTYQDHPEARFVIRLIVAQLSDAVDMFDSEDLPPTRSGLISYEDELRYEAMYGSKPLRSNRPRSFACARETVSDEPPVKGVRRG